MKCFGLFLFDFNAYVLINRNLIISEMLLKDKTCINALFFLYLCRIFMRKIIK